MPATMTTFNTILKEIYEPKIRDQLRTEAIAIRRIERTSEGVTNQVGGKYVVFPVRTRRNHGIGARNEMELLPTPGQQGFNAGRVSLTYQYGGVQLSGQAFELADSNFQAFASALDQEVTNLRTDLGKDQNRQFFGTFIGTMAVITATGANTFTVSSTKTLELGMQIDVIDGTTLNNAIPTVKISNRQITAINQATKVCTYDGASVAVAANDVVVRTGNVRREWIGLTDIVTATGTLYNIDPTVEPVWAAVVDSNASVNRPLSEGLIIQNCDKVRANGGKVSVLFSGLGVRRSYFNLLQQQRRFTNTKEFTGGFSGLVFTTDQGEIPWVSDLDAPDNTIYGLDESELKIYREKDWAWMNRDGSQWQRVIGYDAYQAMLYQYSQLGTHRRGAHFVIKDVTES